MPITGTPAGNPSGCPEPTAPGTTPTPVPVTCVNQHVLVSRTPTEPTTGRPLLTRTHAIEIRGAQRATIKHIMRDVNGIPVDLRNCLCVPDGGSLGSLSSESLGDCACAYQIVFRLSEYLTGSGKEFSAIISDAENGEVTVTLQPEDTQCPGVYFGQFALVECDSDLSDNELGDTTVLFSNHLYVYIGRDLWSTGGGGCNMLSGPPSIMEVRLHLRDTSPEESFLLDNLAFADEEIAHATILPVQYWNEQPPPIGTFSTTNFPYRYHWLTATAGYLFRIAAEQMRRNNLKYSASGVNIDDQNKEPNYEAAAERRLAEWRDFVKRKKAEINLSNAYGTVGSPYGYANYYGY